MRWAARALALLVPLTGCGQYAATRADLAAPPPAAPSVAAVAEESGEGARPARRRRPPRRGRPVGRSGAVASSVRAPGSEAPSRGAAGAPSSPERLAVIVGIDEYPGDRDLTAAEADARSVALALGRVGFTERHTRLLLGRSATSETVLRSLRWLERRSEPGSTGVFFFAGHIRKVGGDPDGDGEEIDEALVTAEGGLVTDGAVAAALADARGRLWLAYAGCYAGGFDDAAGPRRISTYASGEEDLAYESTALGHSFMVEYMVRRAMPEAGTVTVEGLYRWAARRMDGRLRRFRPLQEDAAAGDLVLGALPPEPVPRPPRDASRPCLLVLRCRS